MRLKLNRPICFFDLETTGAKVGKDRIVEIAILKLHPNGTQEKMEKRINPKIQIPFEVS